MRENKQPPRTETYKKQIHIDIPLHCEYYYERKRNEKRDGCATLLGSTVQGRDRESQDARAAGGPKSPHPADDNGLILDQPSFFN